MKSYPCSRIVKQSDGTEIERVYSNAIEGYEDIFSVLLNPKDKQKCMDILQGFYENPKFKYDEQSISI